MTSLKSHNDLKPSEPAALLNAAGNGPFLLVCEHASNYIPAALNDLGLSKSAVQSHVAWDPGALEVSQKLSAILDSPLVISTISRLVYDCNRPPTAMGAMPAISEKFTIPGNKDLTAAQRAQRTEKFYVPFQTLMTETIKAAKQPPVLITVHSFTKTYLDKPRSVELGILHDSDAALADQMLLLAPRHTKLTVRRNDPYGPEHGVTHTLKEHGLKNGLSNVMLEIRNDLIATQQEQNDMALMLATLLQDARNNLLPPTTKDAPNATIR